MSSLSVLEALKRRDADAAEAALPRHIVGFQEKIKSVM
jgi:DNA-binding GntR family transcriptional regulator